MKGLALAVALLAVSPAAAEAKSYSVSLSGSARKDASVTREYPNPNSTFCDGQANDVTTGFVFASIAAKPLRFGDKFSQGNLDFVAKLSGHKAGSREEVTGPGFTPKPGTDPSNAQDCTLTNRGPFVQTCTQFSGDAKSRFGSPFRLRTRGGKVTISWFPESREFAINCKGDQLGGAWMILGVTIPRLAVSAITGLAKGATVTRIGNTVQKNTGGSDVFVTTTLKYTLRIHRVS